MQPLSPAFIDQLRFNEAGLIPAVAQDWLDGAVLMVAWMNREAIEAMYDPKFCRMWEFYLYGTEMMFRSGEQMVFHMQLAHKRDAVPITRDYMGDAQDRFQAWEEERDRPVRDVAASDD